MEITTYHSNKDWQTFQWGFSTTAELSAKELLGPLLGFRSYENGVSFSYILLIPSSHPAKWKRDIMLLSFRKLAAPREQNCSLIFISTRSMPWSLSIPNPPIPKFMNWSLSIQMALFVLKHFGVMIEQVVILQLQLQVTLNLGLSESIDKSSNP